MHALKSTLALTLALLLAVACGGDDKKNDDLTTADTITEDGTGEITAPDTVEPDLVTPDGTPEEDIASDAEETEVVEPESFCFDGQVGADNVFQLAGQDGPIEVLFDTWGVPHVYATTERDLFFAEGFVVARFRIIQMHVMRTIARGIYHRAAAADAGDLGNDVYMKHMKLGMTGEKMWENVAADNPELKAMLEAFADGVNAYIGEVNAGTIEAPFEWPLVGEITPWLPADSLVIGRLQSWDLSFDGRVDQLKTAALYQEVAERWTGTPLAGMLQDLLPLAPATEALSLPAENRRNPPRLDMGKVMGSEFYKRLPHGYFHQVEQTLASIELHPGTEREVGSNNWAIAGEHTESGFPMVANDTHLSLGNPAVFFEIHLNTVQAGGDLDLAGVCFPGIPGIILGRNGKAAWGATVYYADATDIYVETLTLGDTPTVEFNGEQVPIEIRTETFTYKVSGESTCEDWLNDFIKGTDYELVADGKNCSLTVNIWEVPHHGPVIPGSLVEGDGNSATALTWKWTGYEPTNELATVYELLHVETPEGFLKALEHFRVGAQNWVYGDVDGNIAYGAFCRIPVRAQVAGEGAIEFPPFLPVPGNGCCEWQDDVPFEQLPQSINPEQGYIFTANGDALGYTLDGDPFNDESYQGYMFDIGYRAARIQELFEAELAGDGEFSLADVQRIQADHQSPLGKALTKHILAAVEAAEAGEDQSLAPFAGDERIAAAANRLAAWDFTADAGVLDDATAQENENAIATAIFNAWAVKVSALVLANKVESPYDLQWHGRFLVNLFEHPETLATWEVDTLDSILFDNPETEELENRNYITLLALEQALDFLADPETVGPANKGGMGTDDMNEWHWGKLHTLTLKHALGGKYNIPSADVWPDGYPRHSDNFNVDAADPGLSDTGYTFGSGPAIRNVFTLDPAGPKADIIIPGGEDQSFLGKHYRDLFDLWAKNETHPLHADLETLIGLAEACFLFELPAK